MLAFANLWPLSNPDDDPTVINDLGALPFDENGSGTNGLAGRSKNCNGSCNIRFLVQKITYSLRIKTCKAVVE